MLEGSESSPVAAKVHYFLSFRELHFIYLAHLKEVAIRGLATTNTICGIKSTQLNGELHASLWAYLKALDLVTKLEEYPDPRLIIYLFLYSNTYYSLYLSQSIPSWLAWEEIKCTGHVTLPKQPINCFHPLRQSKRAAIRAYRPNIYIYFAHKFK